MTVIVRACSSRRLTCGDRLRWSHSRRNATGQCASSASLLARCQRRARSDLALKKGDIIERVDIASPDGWWIGTTAGVRARVD